MRYFLVAFALLLAPQASAQDAPNIAGFRLGMGVEEARAVAPDLFRRNVENRPSFNVTRHSHFFGDVAFPLSLIFLNGALDFAGGDSTLHLPHVETCFDRHRALVEAIESTVGPLRDSETERRPNTRVRDIEPVRTDAGSYIHRYTSDVGMGAIATKSAPVSVEVRVWALQQRDGLWQCSTTYAMSASAPAPADLPQSTIENWLWITRPTGADFARYYPERALEVRRPGEIIMICVVAEDGALTCAVGHENPSGWGFGQAGLRLAQHFRMALHTMDGAPTAGATVRIPIRFYVNH
jgi:hypothetical protein